MIDLTNKEEIQKLDPKDVYGSTEMFANQCEQIVADYYDLDFYDPKINPGYKDIKNIVLAGMGGSAYGGHVAQSLFRDSLTVPLIVHSDYGLPGFVNKESLVMATSYSGSTEEVLSAFEEGKKRGAKLTGFSVGGKLGELLKENCPGFTFNAKFNPSGQPRLGTGYMIVSTIILLNSLGVISVAKEELNKAITEVRQAQEDIKANAQLLAKELIDGIPVFFAAEHLVGNAHIIRNQFNETAKGFSAFSDLPELNHHLMEGLQNPKDKKLKVVFITSPLYSAKLQKRIQLTKDVVEKNNIPFVEFTPVGSTHLSQVLQTLAFGGYLTLFAGLLYGLDPSLIPWVDYFKAKLTDK